MDKVTLNDDEILEEVKKAIGITGEYQNAPLMIYISEVKEYMAGAGVEAEYIDSNKACGVIARGVMDLWNYGSGKGQLSQYFKERVMQLTI
nr:MAG TPA: hypothetical protein [Caudoviricetes sp.]